MRVASVGGRESRLCLVDEETMPGGTRVGLQQVLLQIQSPGPRVGTLTRGASAPGCPRLGTGWEPEAAHT